jgi:hypothetical protein
MMWLGGEALRVNVQPRKGERQLTSHSESESRRSWREVHSPEGKVPKRTSEERGRQPGRDAVRRARPRQKSATALNARPNLS